MGEPTDEGWTWTEQARSYASNWGWSLLPLSPRVGSGRDADPVVKQLGAVPLIEPSKASADPDVIEEWGDRFEEVDLGIVTGTASGVLAVEVKTGAYGGGEKELFRDRLLEVTGGHCAFVGGARAYVLIPHAHVDEPLPPMTRRRGAILHGEGSIVYAPWRLFEWADDHLSKERGAPRDVVEVTLSMFRVDEHLAPDPEETDGGEPNSSDDSVRREGEDYGANDAAPPPVPWQQDADADRSAGREASGYDQYFRSGEQLQARSAGERRFDLPWTVPGGLSVLTGPPKIAGKSSWVLSLASCLAAGTPFLGTETSPSTIVMLADSASATMRERLAWHDLGDEALSRLHIAHPEDVARAGWGQLLDQAYEHARHVDADLLIVDCLDQYISLKGGPDPTESSRVVHQLTVGAPSEIPLLGVKSTSCSAEEPLSRTIDRLGLLGIGADAIVRLDDVSMPRFPCLRRVLTASRKGTAPQLHICALRRGRYERVRPEKTGHSRQVLLDGPGLAHSANEPSEGSPHVLSS